VIRTLVALLFLQTLASAQLQIAVPSQGSEQPVSGVYDLGSVAVGDTLETKFRLRNLGNAAVTLSSLRVLGDGFTLAGQPSLPHTVAPTWNVDFTVRFQARGSGSYSANLTANGLSILLRASGLAAATIRADGTEISSGASLDFGRVERRASARKQFELANLSNTAVSVRRIELGGQAFRLELAQAPPFELPPGAAASFDVLFQPSTAGVYSGTIAIDGRTIRLTGAAMEPPFTRPAVVLETTPAGSAQQGKVAVRFAGPSRASGNGQLRIDFRSLAQGAGTDTTIQFPSSGSRTLPFTVSEGDSAARFGDSFEAVFQTGTTAGTIVFTAEVGGFTEQTTLSIGTAPVRIDSTSAVRSGGMLEIQAVGYDNTHSLGQLIFTFYDRSGQAVQPGAIRVDAGNDFKRYFESSTLGGAFALRANFPVAGDATSITAVEVELVNPAGSTRTERIRF
jgi:hypothetical protein